MKIDLHVHIIGNGNSGSGCRLNLKIWYHRLLARYMLHLFKLPGDVNHPDLDSMYVDRLRSMVNSSPIDKIVILAHEEVYDSSGKIIPNFGSLYVPNSYVLDLAKKYPEFLAGVSIHPARTDAMEELEMCLERGAVLMKCLPNCQNIDLSDRRFVPFWERMAEAGLPLLSHTGGELSLPVYNRDFQDPRYLELPLKCGVKVIAAHCGTSSLPFTKNHLSKFCDLLSKYPNLYGDNSGMQTPFRSKHFRAVLKEPFASRVVHGSDLPIPISGIWALLRGLITLSQLKEAHANDNFLSRDVSLKKAMGFSDNSFTRIESILRI